MKKISALTLIRSDGTAPQVDHIVTVPGMWGISGAWGGEFIISMILILAVLFFYHFKHTAAYTGGFVGILIALFVTFEAPLSGMSNNPARTFGSAAVGHVWTGWRSYDTAPVAGMLAGVFLSRIIRRERTLLCARLNHSLACGCIPANVPCAMPALLVHQI